MIKLIICILTSIGLYFIPLTKIYGQTLPHKFHKDNQIVKYDGFIISYNETHEQPNWVYYVVKPDDFVGGKIKRVNSFKVDKSILTGSAELSDYKGSGYDRGHLKPAGDEPCNYNQMSETFYMTNISPQNPSFNRGIWKRLESYVRRVALKSDSVIVITGGVLVSGLKAIGDNKVSVPNHFYKVMRIYNDGAITTYCFVIGNKKSNEPLYSFRVELREVEKLVNIIF